MDEFCESWFQGIEEGWGFVGVFILVTFVVVVFTSILGWRGRRFRLTESDVR